MADRYMSRIQIRRGLRSQFPNLNDGEIGYAVDTKELFIGYNRQHISILTDSQADKIYSDLTNIKDKIEYSRHHQGHNGGLFGTDLLGNGKHFRHGNNRGQRSILNQRNGLIGYRRQNTFNHLRKNNFKKSLYPVIAQNLCRFILSY